MLKHFNNQIDQVKNSILTTDNYVDKYLGFKMIKNLMSTLREIYQEEQVSDELLKQSKSKAMTMDTQEVLDRIIKVEGIKMKELYAKMMVDQGQPPEFKG